MKKTIIAIMLFTLSLSGLLEAKSAKYTSSYYKYIGLFEKAKKRQHMEMTMNLDAMRKIIRIQWSKGYDIAEIKYGNGKWIAVFENGSPKSHQTYIVARRWEAVNDHLDEYWQQGYYITNIEHGLAEWFVVFEKNTSFTNQAYERRKSLDDFSDAVNKRWKMGYDLIDIEYGEGHYTGIFAEGSKYNGQALTIRSRWIDMARVISDYWKQGYYVSNIEFTLGRWMTVFSKYTSKKDQGFETAESIEKFRQTFEKRQDKGYKLVDIAEGW